MRPLIAAVFFIALLAPACAAPANAVRDDAARPGDRPILLALNPQPEPPGRAKISASTAARTTRGGTRICIRSSRSRSSRRL